MLSGLFQFFAVIAAALFMWRRSLRYLRFFQQEEYKPHDYLTWLKRTGAYERQGSAIAGVAALLLLVFPKFSALICLGAAVALFARFVLEVDPRVSGKLRLQMTGRATRLSRVNYGGLILLLCIIASLTLVGAKTPVLFFLLLILVFQALAFAPAASGQLVSPFEEGVNNRFINVARRKFAEHNPFCIGITGSFGKTSTKSLLGQILNVALGPTFWPQKGVNTILGTTREIRERLSGHHRYAVIEMGAYYIGSIKKMTEFTPPQAAIVTAVGTMHLERFGSADNVYKAKSELAEAVPADGILVCNGDNPGARRMASENQKATTILYGFEDSFGPLDCRGRNLAFTEKGSQFQTDWKGKSYQVSTPLLGAPAASNMLGAFAMACALGADPDLVVAVLGTVEPVDNRLVLKSQGKVRYLQDAYNSNPVGFRAALEVLKGLAAKRRILMTPGMVELGNTQAQENEDIGKFAATVCDLVVVVAQTNRAALLKGLRAGGLSEDKIIVAETRSEAFSRLEEITGEGDLVLIENDLPDKLEFRERF
jgi:UDP-N-acetylmuramoyl-tripeptide--D-alanyl-D-alanine ligase